MLPFSRSRLVEENAVEVFLVLLFLDVKCQVLLDTFKYHVFAPMTEVTSTPTKPVDNVVIATKGLQDRKIQQLGRRWKIKVN